MYLSPRSPAMVRTPGLPSKVCDSGRGSDSSLLSAAGLTLGLSVGIVTKLVACLDVDADWKDCVWFVDRDDKLTACSGCPTAELLELLKAGEDASAHRSGWGPAGHFDWAGQLSLHEVPPSTAVKVTLFGRLDFVTCTCCTLGFEASTQL